MPPESSAGLVRVKMDKAEEMGHVSKEESTC